jgi:2-polyprenyl-3-methyl-5-hydroxy-6-metoxy-1,4-benzoquinol methylase
MAAEQAHVCPVWVGYLLLNPLRRLFEHPERLLSPFVRPGMTVLEPGCGPGFFTLPLARMVGENGQVICADVQEKMLDIVRRRAESAGLSKRIDLRTVSEKGLAELHLHGEVDLAVAIHMVHEVPDKERFLRDIHNALKHGGRLFVREPRFHVSREMINRMKGICRDIGFDMDAASNSTAGRTVVLIKS